MYVCLYVCVWMYVFMYVSMYACIVCTHARVYAGVYVYVCIYTNIDYSVCGSRRPQPAKKLLPPLLPLPLQYSSIFWRVCASLSLSPKLNPSSHCPPPPPPPSLSATTSTCKSYGQVCAWEWKTLQSPCSAIPWQGPRGWFCSFSTICGLLLQPAISSMLWRSSCLRIAGHLPLQSPSAHRTNAGRISKTSVSRMFLIIFVVEIRDRIGCA